MNGGVEGVASNMLIRMLFELGAAAGISTPIVQLVTEEYDWVAPVVALVLLSLAVGLCVCREVRTRL